MRLPASRLAGAALGAVLAVGVVAGPAGAAPGTVAHPPVLQTAWFGVHPEDTAGQTLPVDSSGVPKGDLAVAYYGSSDTAPNKESFVAWNLGGLPAHAHISTFTVTLTVDAASSPQTVTPPKLVACLPQGTWPAGENQDSTRGEPPLDCSHSVAGVFSGGAYTFNVPSYAQQWLSDVNVGIGITNAPSATTPFQITFKDAPQIKATLNYTVPSVPAQHPTPQQPATNQSGSTPTTGTGPTSSNQLPPTGTGTVPPPPTDTGTTVTPPVPGQQPQVAPSQPSLPGSGAAGSGSPHRAFAIQAGSSLPSAGFWVAGVLLLLTLIAVSLAVGDLDTEASSRRRISRLDIVLRTRRSQRTQLVVAPR